MYRKLPLLDTIFVKLFNYHITCNNPTVENVTICAPVTTPTFKDEFNELLFLPAAIARIKDEIMNSYKQHNLSVIVSYQPDAGSLPSEQFEHKNPGNKVKTIHDIYGVIKKINELSGAKNINSIKYDAINPTDPDYEPMKKIREINFNHDDLNIIFAKMVPVVDQFPPNSAKKSIIEAECKTIMNHIFETHVDNMLRYLEPITRKNFLQDYFRCAYGYYIDIDLMYMVLNKRTVGLNEEIDIKGINSPKTTVTNFKSKIKKTPIKRKIKIISRDKSTGNVKLKLDNDTEQDVPETGDGISSTDVNINFLKKSIIIDDIIETSHRTTRSLDNASISNTRPRPDFVIHTDNNEDVLQHIKKGTILYKRNAADTSYYYLPLSIHQERDTILKPIPEDIDENRGKIEKSPPTFSNIGRCDTIFWQYYFMLGDYLFFNIINVMKQTVNLLLGAIDFHNIQYKQILTGVKKNKTNYVANHDYMVDFSNIFHKQRSDVYDKMINKTVVDPQYFLKNIKKN